MNWMPHEYKTNIPIDNLNEKHRVVFTISEQCISPSNSICEKNQNRLDVSHSNMTPANQSLRYATTIFWIDPLIYNIKRCLLFCEKITLCKIHHILRCQLTQYCTVPCFRHLLKPILIEKHRMEFVVLDQRFFRKKSRTRNGENESLFLIQNHAFVDLLYLSSRVCAPSIL